MMNVEVINGFVNHNGVMYGVGEIIENIDNSDGERLCVGGWCEKLTETDTDSVDEAEIVEEEKALNEMTKDELIEYATSIGIEINEKARKADIIKAIYEADSLNTNLPE